MRRNNWKCTFESLGKAYAFGVNYLVYRYLVKILRKKTRKFTCNSSKRKDSGNVNVTGQNLNIWWLLDERNPTNEKMRNRQSSKKWSFFSGCNDYKGRTNTLEPSTTQLKQWVQTYLFEMKYVPRSSNANRKIQSHRFKWQRNIAIIWISIVESPLDQY